MINKARSLGVAVLGGYCELLTENPLEFKFIKGSTSLVPATSEDFNSAQKNGNITFEPRSESEMWSSL